MVGHTKAVLDKHYYTPEISNAKIAAVNNVFESLKIIGHN